MNQYEVMYIIDAALEDSARNEVIERFSDLVVKNGGTVECVDVEKWGKRRLAYAINYKTEGYYVLMYVRGPATLPRELERNFQISDKVLRALVTRYEGEIPGKREETHPYAAREPEATVETEPAPAQVAEPVAQRAPVVEEAPAVEPIDDEKPESEAE